MYWSPLEPRNDAKRFHSSLAKHPLDQHHGAPCPLPGLSTGPGALQGCSIQCSEGSTLGDPYSVGEGRPQKPAVFINPPSDVNLGLRCQLHWVPASCLDELGIPKTRRRPAPSQDGREDSRSSPKPSLLPHSPTPVHGIIFHEDSPWCQESQGPLT